MIAKKNKKQKTYKQSCWKLHISKSNVMYSLAVTFIILAPNKKILDLLDRNFNRFDSKAISEHANLV